MDRRIYGQGVRDRIVCYLTGGSVAALGLRELTVHGAHFYEAAGRSPGWVAALTSSSASPTAAVAAPFGPSMAPLM